jgi:hypothetical protein
VLPPSSTLTMEATGSSEIFVNFLPDYTVSHPESQYSSHSVRSDIVELHLFISLLFNDAVSSSDCIGSNGGMIVNTELEKMWKEAFVAD